MSPALSAVFSRLVFREPLPIRTWIAVVIAFLFMMLSVIGDLANNPDSTGTAALPVALPVFQGAFFSTSRYFGSIVQPPVDMVPSLAVAGFYNAIVSLIVLLFLLGESFRLLLPVSSVDGMYLFLQSAILVPFGALQTFVPSFHLKTFCTFSLSFTFSLGLRYDLILLNACRLYLSDCRCASLSLPYAPMQSGGVGVYLCHHDFWLQELVMYKRPKRSYYFLHNHFLLRK